MTSPRLKKELARFVEQPPEGITCYPKDDKLNLLTATMTGPQGSPYEGGLFELEIEIHKAYPMRAPNIRFLTPVFHPNIDNGGRICMDLLKPPDKLKSGGWNPTISLENLLVALRGLLANPNPDDPVMPDIAMQFRNSKSKYEKMAKYHTELHAKKN